MSTLEITKINGGVPEPKPGGMYPAPAILPPKKEDNYRPEEDLQDTRKMRSAIVSALTSEGIPVGDKDQMKLLLATIKDQDSQALSVIRAKVEAGNADAMDEIRTHARMMLEVVREQGVGNIIPKRRANSDVVDVPVLDVSELPDDEKQPFVEDQLAVGTSTMKFDDFVKIHGDVKLAEEEEPDE